MYLPLFISGFIIGVSGIFFYRKRVERDEKVKKTRYLQKKYKSTTFIYPSVYQTIILLESNEIFKKMYIILTLKKNFCLSQLLFSEQKEFVILKGYLKKKISNFYINNIKLGNIHFGSQFCTKSPNIRNYSCFGAITKKIEEFCYKYDFAHFYGSYWPTDKKLINLSQIGDTTIFLQCNIRLLDDKSFIEDFFSCFTDIQDETSKRLELEKNKLREYIEKSREYEKKDFVEKLLDDINKNANKDVILKKKDKKKSKK